MESIVISVYLSPIDDVNEERKKMPPRSPWKKNEKAHKGNRYRIKIKTKEININHHHLTLHLHTVNHSSIPLSFFQKKERKKKTQFITYLSQAKETEDNPYPIHRSHNSSKQTKQTNKQQK